jgi:hypothetical protein
MIVSTDPTRGEEYLDELRGHYLLNKDSVPWSQIVQVNPTPPAAATVCAEHGRDRKKKHPEITVTIF